MNLGAVGGHHAPGQEFSRLKVSLDRIGIERDGVGVVERVEIDDIYTCVHQDGPLGIAAAVNARQRAFSMDRLNNLIQLGHHIFTGDAHIRRRSECRQNRLVDKANHMLGKLAELANLPAALHGQRLHYNVHEFLVVIDGALVLVNNRETEADWPRGLNLHIRTRPAGGFKSRFHGVDAL